MKTTNKKSKKKLVWIILSIILVLIIIGSLGGNSEKTDSVTSDTKGTIQESNWEYTNDVDQMTGNNNYYAKCISKTKIDFEFPYDGGSFFTLVVRSKGHGNEVLLTVSKGQFMTSLMSSESCKIKFDDNQPIAFKYNMSNDASADVIFFDNSDEFVKKLITAKKLLIEATFFNEGNKVIEFDVSGLNWNR